MTSSVKPPVWFWVVSVIALLWNLMGVSAYLFDAFISVEQLEAMAPELRELYEGRPAWVTAAFALAVFGGFIGSIGLLLRKKWAKPLFMLSLVAVLAQNVYTFFMSNTLDAMGTQTAIMPIFVILISIYLVYFSKRGIEKNWLS